MSELYPSQSPPPSPKLPRAPQLKKEKPKQKQNEQ